jgi:type IV pilus assembly protein PilA
MKAFFNRMNSQNGFTLVELMVVVAIIGLLSGVAIPNFKKYQAKSKMSEARLHLSSIYTAQAAFFSDYNMYHNCLEYMGYNPSAEKDSRYYATGIAVDADIHSVAHDSAVNSGLNGTDCAQKLSKTSGKTWFPAGKGVGSVVANADSYLSSNSSIGTQEDASKMTFKAAAAGVISGNFSADDKASLVTIDEIKSISVIRNGF